MPSIKPFAAICCVCCFGPLSTAAEPSDAEQATYVAQPSQGESGDRSQQSRAPRPLPVAKAKSLPLPPRGSARSSDDDESKPARPVKPGSSLLTGLAALSIVLGLFFMAAWALRRGMPAAPVRLPAEVVDVLGRTPLATRQYAHLVRCGNKLLLVHLAPGTAETLTEITDPAEVDRILGLCRQSHPQSTTATFRQIFQQFSREKSDA